MQGNLVRSVRLTGRERFLGADELIVTKTDLQGRITYANRVFRRISEYGEAQLLGAPHNIVRHPDMPRCVFKLLWDTISSGREIFAYVVNVASNGDHYWVLAHVTPTFDENGAIIGYHSNRRMPERSSVDNARALYAQLSAEEKRHSSPARAAEAGLAKLNALLSQAGQTYEQFFFTL